MQGKVQLIRKKRVYSKEFKEDLVGLFEQGKFSVLQLGRLYGVRFSLIYQWIYRYSTLNEKGCRIVEMKQSSTSKLKELEQRVKELEQMLGQKQIRIEFLEKMIDLPARSTRSTLKKTPPPHHQLVLPKAGEAELFFKPAVPGYRHQQAGGKPIPQTPAVF